MIPVFTLQPMVMHLACVTMHMSMPEALNAATINAAHALGLAGRHGSIEVGKYANMLILNADRYDPLLNLCIIIESSFWFDL